jgi:glycerol kinase
MWEELTESPAKRVRSMALMPKKKLIPLPSEVEKAANGVPAQRQTQHQSQNKKRYLLAIDQGTTGTTINLLHIKGDQAARVNLEHKQYYPEPGWVEHKPEDIWKNVASTIEACLKKARVRANDIAAVGITNQRETVAVWERKTSRVLHNAIVWQDRRTAKECDQWKKDGAEAMIIEKTGLVIDPYFSASKLKWLLDNVSGLRGKVEKGEVAFGTIDSFLLWRLTGGVAHKTDVSNASRTQLMNIQTGLWDDELLKFFSIPINILPEISDSSGLFGVTHGLKFLPDGIPITGIAGDQQAALFGQACFLEGDAKCTFGTGSFLLMNSGQEMVRSTSGLLTTIAWRLKGQQKMTYALEGGAFVCGAAVQFLRDQMGFIKESKEIEKLASSVKDSEGVEFVPALTGLGAPYWDPHARGLICGLTRGTTRGHIARATLEAMALQNTEILLAMQEDLKQPLRSVKVDGGASANGLLMQMQTDFLGVDVVRPKMIETTSAGAAYLAALGAGIYSDFDEIKKIWKVDRVYRSKSTVEERAARLQRWQLAVRRARL